MRPRVRKPRSSTWRTTISRNERARAMTVTGAAPRWAALPSGRHQSYLPEHITCARAHTHAHIHACTHASVRTLTRRLYSLTVEAPPGSSSQLAPGRYTPRRVFSEPRLWPQLTPLGPPLCRLLGVPWPFGSQRTHCPDASFDRTGAHGCPRPHVFKRQTVLFTLILLLLLSEIDCPDEGH